VFILYALLIALIVGILAGGRLARLGALSIRWSWVIAGGLAAQLVLFSDPVTRIVGHAGPVIYVATTGCVLLAVLANRRIVGIPLVVAGAAANMAAIIANGGFMPASAAALAALGKADAGERPFGMADATFERLREQEPEAETVYYIYVVDRSEHLRGVFSLRELLMTPPEKKVRDFMTENPVSVQTDASEEEITNVIAKYNLLALPVVDEENRLLGVVTVDDVVDLLLPPASRRKRRKM